MGEAIPRKRLLSFAGKGDEPDPHVWLSPDRRAGRRARIALGAAHEGGAAA